MATELPTLVAELYDLARWIDQMPAVPGHHRNADALWETYQTCVEEAIGWDETGRLGDAFVFVLEQDKTRDGEAEFWRDVAAALEVELVEEA